MKKYPGLKIVSEIVRVSGILVFFGFVLLAVLLAMKPETVPGMFRDFEALVAVMTILVGGIVSAMIYAFGDFLQVVMDIEENTRHLKPD